MKTTTIRLAALATMLAAASFGAHAAESADLAVRGIIRPSACNISLSGNGTVNFGTISALTLSSTASTVLPNQSITLSVACDAPTAVSISMTDNRIGTASTTALGGDMEFQFGLGNVDNQSVGAYTIRLDTPTADGSEVARITSWQSSEQGTWAALPSDNLAKPRGNARIHSWAASGSTTPGAYSNITQPLTVRAAIPATSQLPDLTQSIPLDGLATISLTYL